MRSLPLSVASLLLVTTLALPEADAGVHIGNLHLRTRDDATPLVTMDPDWTPRLALRTCGQETPTLIDAEYTSSGLPYFPLDSDLGDICAVGLSLGAPLDLEVGGYNVATVSPSVISLTVSPTPVADLVNRTVRVGTPAMMTQVRALQAVPRQATASEAAQIESALSVLILD